MPRTARGIVFTGPREVALEDFVLPDPGPQQALLRLTRTLVSAGTEVSSLLGPTAPGPTALEPSASPNRWPVRPGYSSVGVVEAVGQGVSGLAPGDRVLTGGRHASHVLLDIDPAAPASPPGTRQNPQRGPHFAVPIPPGVSDEAAAFAVLGAVALHGFRKVAFQPGEKLRRGGPGRGGAAPGAAGLRRRGPAGGGDRPGPLAPGAGPAQRGPRCG